GGEIFLKQLAAELKAYSPLAYANSESFGGNNFITRRLDQGGHGYTNHNNADLYGWFYDTVQKRTEEVDMGRLKTILRNIWGWYEMAVVNYLGDHDEF